MDFTRGIWTIVAGFLCLLTGAMASDCTPPSAMEQATLNCFTTRNIPTGVTPDNITNLAFHDVSMICRHQSDFKDAFTCALDIMRNCLRAQGRPSSTLPDSARVRDGIDFLCRNLTDIDVTCTKDGLQTQKQCFDDKLSTLKRSGVTDYKVLTCESSQASYVCARAGLAVCRGKTMDIYTEWYKKYYRPPACDESGGAGSLHSLAVCLWVMLAVLTGFYLTA